MDPPTARDNLRNGRQVEVHCRYCRRHRLLDLQAIVDSGRGDVPMVRLPFRCTSCDSTNTGLIVQTKQWRPK
jgi:hypothetical protein